MKDERMQKVVDSPIGPLYLVASLQGLQGIFWKKQPVEMGKSPILAKTEKELSEFFEGKRKSFTVPLEPARGTEFQRRVWKELSKIPYGKTISYTELATRVQNPKAVRAVGSANGKNPLSIIVPCHRVIASDGSLGGYAGGLRIKTWLLELEKAKR